MLGTAVLWTSRRRDEPLRRRYGRRALITIAALVAAYFVVLPVAIAVVVNHKARAPIVAPDLGRPHEQVSLRTSDGLELVGWYAPSRNRAAVIVFPGHDGPAPHARMLVRRGYGVLMLDRRGEGDSQGDYNARGWGGEPDLEAAISYLAKRDDVDSQRIGGLGLSVGGELLIQTAARDGRLAAVVSEGAGNQSLADQMQTPDAPKALRWLSPMTMETAAGIVLSNRRPPPGLADGDPADRSAPGPAHHGRSRQSGRGAERRLPGCGRPDGFALGDPRGGPHRGPRRGARPVRAPRGRLLRVGPAPLGVERCGLRCRSAGFPQPIEGLARIPERPARSRLPPVSNNGSTRRTACPSSTSTPGSPRASC